MADAPTLADLDTGAPRRKPGTKCAVSLVRAALAEKVPADQYLDVFDRWMTTKDALGGWVYADSYIRYRVRAAIGIDLSGFSIARHRRGDCQCRP